MQKDWESSVYVEAPVEKVFAYLADVSRHPEWDASVAKVERISDGLGGDAGSEWKVYERLNVLQGKGESRWNSAGIAHRELREVVPHSRVSWQTHPVPAVGISAVFAWDLEPEGSGTRVTQRVRLTVPGLVHKVGKLVARKLDENQMGLWERNLQNLKAVAEGASVPNLAVV
ncbi:MAG TPA: SRPBCC family protein [Thermomicrobiales bacterium]